MVYEGCGSIEDTFEDRLRSAVQHSAQRAHLLDNEVTKGSFMLEVKCDGF